MANRLCLDPPIELLVQPLDRIDGACAFPLTRRQTREGEQPLAGLLQAVADRLSRHLRMKALRRVSISSLRTNTPQPSRRFKQRL
jgi:hypothetical protein